jgi:hypothetical protein
VYGVALIAVMLTMPDGIAGGLIRAFRRREPKADTRSVGPVVAVPVQHSGE